MRFQVNYRIIASFYDCCEILFFCQKRKSPRQAMISYLPDEPLHILEVCTGTAINSIIIAEHKPNAAIVGIDISKEMLSVARKKIERRKLNSIQLLEMDAARLEFVADVFDVVIISLVLHEMGKPLAKKVMDEAKRVLKPGGKVLVVEWEQPQTFFQKMMFRIIKLLEYDNFEHFLKMNFDKYFEENGFRIKGIQHCDYTRIFELGIQATP